LEIEAKAALSGIHSRDGIVLLILDDRSSDLTRERFLAVIGFFIPGLLEHVNSNVWNRQP